MTDDQERLVAEALRAHAARTPLPEPEHVDATADPADPGGYGPPTVGAPPADPPTVQTSGYPASKPAGLPTAPPAIPTTPPTAATARPTPSPTPPPVRTGRLEPAGGIAVGWVVLLALLLGLASGAVVGLLTLL